MINGSTLRFRKLASEANLFSDCVQYLRHCADFVIFSADGLKEIKKGPGPGFEPGTEDPQSHMLTRLHYPGHYAYSAQNAILYKFIGSQAPSV